jgi:hypothetical protein
MAASRASLHHRDPAMHPSAGMLDRPTRSWVLGLSRLEEVKDVLRARGSPKSEEMVIRIGESPTTADRHEAGVPDLREDHGWPSLLHTPAEDPRFACTTMRDNKHANPAAESASQYVIDVRHSGRARPPTTP